MSHDFQSQRDETLSVWSELSSANDLPASAILELQFVPKSESADGEALEARLIQAGYRVERYEDDGEETLEASIGPIELSAEAIWSHELAATEISIECGYSPDGWCFSSGG